LERIIAQNNDKVSQLQAKQAEEAAKREAERLAELERIRLENEEKKKREDARRLEEVQRKLAEEEEKKFLMGKGKARAPIGFSFGL